LVPNESDGYAARGAIYLAKGECAEAVKELNRAVEIEPDYSSAYFYRANCYYRTGDFDRAVADYDEAIKHNRGLDEDYINEVYKNRQKALEMRTNKASQHQ
jgi:Putative Zn-dependent protease, contains TPR repeats